MSSIYGREVGVAGSLPNIERLVWIDLTAGDGIPEDGLEWKTNCSPGINAYHATKATKPVDVTLYEIQPATFDRLIDSLTVNLPDIGYQQVTETTWRFGRHVTLRAVCGSGEAADVSGIRKTDAVLVSNDPNAITTWAMRSSFAGEVGSRAWCFRSISTMGCNPAGLKRSDASVRAGWFDLVRQQEAALPGHRDLLLAAIEGDSAQWAYLLCEPARWRVSVEKSVDTAFKKHGYAMEKAWYRVEQRSFQSLKDRLFLTHDERKAAA
jgi:hypothetical protein